MALRSGTTYYYRVKAIKATAESPVSQSVAVTTLSDNETLLQNISPPSTPVILLKANNIVCIIKPPSAEFINNYAVQVSAASDFSSFVVNKIYLLSDFTNEVDIYKFYLDNLAPGTTYYVRVRSYNALSSSGLSNVVTFVPPTKTAPPILIGAINISAITATIKWLSVKNATNYYIDVATNATFSNLVVNNLELGAVTSYTVPVLIENTAYFVRLRSKVNNILSIYSSTLIFSTLNGSDVEPDLSFNPATPVVQSITNLFTNTVRLQWSSVGDVFYEVTTSLSSDFASVVHNIVTQDTFTVLNNLTADTVYYVRIRAFNIGSSGYTNLTVKTLVENSGLIAPQLVISPSQPSTSISGNIVQRNYATSYYIHLGTDSAFTTFASVFTSSAYFAFSGLNSNTQYFLRVYGLNSLNASPASSPYTITTGLALPVITYNDVTVTETTATLSWIKSTAYAKYYVDVRKANSTLPGLEGGLYKYQDIGFVDTYNVDLLLTPGTEYYYRLTGTTASGDTKSTPWISFTTLIPASLLSLNAGNLTWTVNTLNKLEGSTSSLFKHCIEEASPKTLEGNNCPIYNLLKKYGHLYFRAYLDNNTLQSAVTSIISTASLPFVFTPVTSNTTIKIEANNIGGSYTALIKRKVSNNWVTVPEYPYPLAFTSELLFAGLVPSAEYSIECSYNSINIENFTVILSKVADVFATYTMNGAIASPTVTIEHITDTYITITLAPNKTHVVRLLRDNFTVYYKEIYGTSLTIEVIPFTDYELSVTEVNNTTSTYGVIVNIPFTSESSTFEDIAPLSAACNISGTSIINTEQATVTWTVVPEATDYVIEVSKTNTFSLIDQNVYITRLNKQSALLSALNPTLRYYVRVYAFNRRFMGDYSASVMIDTTP